MSITRFQRLRRAPFVKELRERARRIMESGEGLEITGTQRAQESADPKRLQ